MKDLANPFTVPFFIEGRDHPDISILFPLGWRSMRNRCAYKEHLYSLAIQVRHGGRTKRISFVFATCSVSSFFPISSDKLTNCQRVTLMGWCLGYIHLTAAAPLRRK